MGGTRITFYVPFLGDSQLVQCRPSTFNLNPPRASVVGGDLLFVYDRTAEDVSKIGGEFERDKENLKSHLSWISRDAGGVNSGIRGTAKDRITARREKLLRDRGIVESLGFPLRRRSDVPRTYASPEVRRRITPRFPSPSSEPYKPDPTLTVDDYEHILTVIQSMVTVMELRNYLKIDDESRIWAQR